ncbi:hypothetical protein [Micromonospora radicis]|nr:hypothetical protein [Micromonospora radicis]
MSDHTNKKAIDPTAPGPTPDAVCCAAPDTVAGVTAVRVTVWSD